MGRGRREELGILFGIYRIRVDFWVGCVDNRYMSNPLHTLTLDGVPFTGILSPENWNGCAVLHVSVSEAARLADHSDVLLRDLDYNAATKTFRIDGIVWDCDR